MAEHLVPNRIIGAEFTLITADGVRREVRMVPMHLELPVTSPWEQCLMQVTLHTSLGDVAGQITLPYGPAGYAP